MRTSLVLLTSLALGIPTVGTAASSNSPKADPISGTYTGSAAVSELLSDGRSGEFEAHLKHVIVVTFDGQGNASGVVMTSGRTSTGNGYQVNCESQLSGTYIFNGQRTGTLSYNLTSGECGPSEGTARFALGGSAGQKRLDLILMSDDNELGKVEAVSGSGVLVQAD